MVMKLKAAIAAVFLLGWNSVFAQDITTCKDPKGYAHFHHKGIVGEDDAGWRENKITDGLLTLKKLASGKYDILIRDATNSINSFAQDGSQIILVRKGANDAAFYVAHSGGAIEIYNFWESADGNYYYDLLQSKGGNAAPVHVSSVMLGSCTPIAFNLIN